MKHNNISISSLGYDMNPNGHQCYNIVNLIVIKTVLNKQILEPRQRVQVVGCTDLL